jgi:ammonium transporter, Amt family
MRLTRLIRGMGAVAALSLLPALVLADEAPKLNPGDTAWMLTSTALVLMMTIPGLALFYAGMVRAKNVLSVLMQCFAITSLVTVLWALFAYSVAFGEATPYWGGLANAFMHGVGVDVIRSGTTVPETVFMTFQMTFAIITPALIVGAFAERMKFSAMLWFMGLWLALVYSPIAHWVWGPDGWLGSMGVLDFAGGTVVHINAGIAGLVAALVLGKRKGYPTTQMMPHNLGYTVVGASLLWVGWFGFNAGSAVAANGSAGMAMAVTQIATATAALGWMFAEWLAHGKPSVLGIASGAVAGLVAITPASGFVGPMGALLLGAAAGVICFLAATKMKRVLGYDDSLDAFGVHAIGGIIGALLTGVFCCTLDGLKPELSLGSQVFIQLKGVVVTIVYDAVVSFIILKVLDVIMGLRVTDDQETEGLDLALHDERGYSL